MKTVDYKKLVKLPADTMFSTISKMNELGEVLVMGEYPDGRRFIYSPLADAGGAGENEIDFDENSFNRAGSFVVWEKAELEAFVDKVKDLISPALESFMNKVADAVAGANPDRTPIVPIVCPESMRNFAAADLVPPIEVTLSSGAVVATAPFAIGAHFNLLGIGETRSLLDTGIYDTTDALDSAITLKRIYLHLETLGLEDEVIAVDVAHALISKAHSGPQDMYREMRILFHENVSLVANHVTVTGELSKILTHGWIPQITISGSVHLELGDTHLFAQRIDSFQQDEKLVRAKVIAYDLDAGRVNHNRRRRAA